MSPLPSARNGSERLSRFTYRQLSQLASYSPSNPLRVVVHVDLDAFYAQCEMVRLGVPEHTPHAVQQWQGLIVVNYPAREAGISHHCNIAEALKLCPDLIAIHVATWCEGESKWTYRDDAAAKIASDKVSLDTYRLESRKILALVKKTLPPQLQKVEKASIDEVFLDLSAHVHSVLIQRFPELCAPPPYDDATERLPLTPITALDWEDDFLVESEEEEEAHDTDWDDVVMFVGSEIVRSVRAAIRKELGYTCSAGVASNKLLSKLGSGFKKPNRQTVVRNRVVSGFLVGSKLTQIRNLGGKLGDQVVSAFHTESVKEIRELPLDQLQTKLGDETGAWLYNTVRGVDASEVKPRTQIKSILSAKSFRPSITNPDQAIRWLRIFAADIYARLVEDGVMDNKRRPRTINLQHRTAGQTRSRQCPIRQGKALDEEVLFQLSRDLLSQLLADGHVWPCANLSLSVGGFEDGVKGNLGIDGFLIKGDMQPGAAQSPISDDQLASGERLSKKRCVRGDEGLFRFFARPSASECKADNIENQVSTENEAGVSHSKAADLNVSMDAEHQPGAELPSLAQDAVGRTSAEAWFRCLRCETTFPDARSLQTHTDWHLAKELQEEVFGFGASESGESLDRSRAKQTSASTKRVRYSSKLGPGQRQLNFG